MVGIAEPELVISSPLLKGGIAVEIASPTNSMETEDLAAASDGPYQLQSLVRAFAVLEMLSKSDVPLRLAEISQRMQIHKSTVHRSLMVLERISLIERTANNHFRLGMKLYKLGSRAVQQMDLRTRIRPYFQRLSTQFGMTVHLGVLQKTSVVYLDKAEPNRRICLSSKTGSTNPVYCTSLGKAMLAYLPEEAAGEIIEQIDFIRFTPKTICSKGDLLEALYRVRKREFAVNDEEIEMGVRCVGAPVFDENNVPIAALSMSGPKARVTAHTAPMIADKLIRCCAEVSASLRMHQKRKAHILGSYMNPIVPIQIAGSAGHRSGINSIAS